MAQRKRKKHIVKVRRLWPVKPGTRVEVEKTKYNRKNAKREARKIIEREVQ